MTASPDPHAVDTFKAMVDVIVPGVGDHPPASAIGVHLHVARNLEMLQPGAVHLLVKLLDMHARVERSGARFVELEPAARDRTLRSLATDDLDEMRDVVEAVHAYTLNGYLTEWAGDPPAVWRAMGFHGPALAHEVADA